MTVVLMEYIKGTEKVHLLKISMCKRTLLIGVEGGEDSCGSTGQGRPRRRF